MDDLTTKIETWLRDEITAAAKPFGKAMAREAERHAKRQREIGDAFQAKLEKVFATAPDDEMRRRLREHAEELVAATARALAPLTVASGVAQVAPTEIADDEIEADDDEPDATPEPTLARLDALEIERPERPREIEAAKVGKRT